MKKRIIGITLALSIVFVSIAVAPGAPIGRPEMPIAARLGCGPLW